jgi:hypothetical protein
MKKFVHIGYPKNFSTSLQCDFFAKHPQLFHLGIGPQLLYCDSITDATFEVYLKTAKGFKYAEVEERLKKHFSSLFKKAQESGKIAVTVSSEHLSFAFSNDALGFDEKMSRLAQLMGSETTVFAIIRNQFDLIKSLYRESVRVGFPGDFSLYTYLLYKYQDRNYYYDFRYDLAYEVMCKYFTSENVHFIVFENMRNAKGELIKTNGEVDLLRSLCDLLEVDYLKTKFGHYNEALENSTIIAKVELNKIKSHDLGNMQLETAEKHRMKHYLFDELELQEEEALLYSDVITKRALIEEAKKHNYRSGDRINYQVDGDIAHRMKQFYEEGNSKLSLHAGLELPDDYFNLSF